MPITAINSVRADRAFYSRFEPQNSIVNVAVDVTGTGSDVKLTLIKHVASGTRQIFTTTKVGVGADFVEAIDLNTLLNSDGYPLATMSRMVGDYTLTAELVSDPSIKASTTLTIVLVTPGEMRARWCFGLPLYAVETVMPRTQPVVIGGVVVTSMGRASLGAGVLAWVFATKTLSWRGGAAVTINMLGPQTYTLPDPSGLGYMVVDVTPASLPGIDLSETLIIDYGQMTDQRIAEIIMDECDLVERGIDAKLEPRRSVTRRLSPTSTDYDEVIDGVAWYRPEDMLRWLHITFPTKRIQKLYALSGWTSETKVVDIPSNWYSITSINGFVELIPSSVAVVQWYYYGPWMPGLIALQNSIAQFWQFDVVSGLLDIPRGLREHVAKRAAITILTSASLARYPSGATSYSISRDGVSESRSVQPGVYANTIQRYLDDTGQGSNRKSWDLDDWKEQLTGLNVVVL